MAPIQRNPIRTSADFTKRKRKWAAEKVFFFSFSILLLGLDLSVKELARSYLASKSVPFIPRLISLRLICNSGAALGVLASHAWIVGIVEIIGCAAFAIGIFFSRRLLLSWAFSLGLAGGAGNLADIYLFSCAVCICIFLFRFDNLRGKNEKSDTSSRKPGR